VTAFRSGVVAVVGRPNVGKSTLVNALVGSKVAIVSDKPQTTRASIRGILTTEEFQVVFTDTPGFHKPRTTLGSRLNAVVSNAVDGVDVVVHVVDAANGVGRGDAFVWEHQVRPSRARARYCAVNKADRLRGHDVVPQLAAAGELGDYDEIVPVSAKTGDGLPELLELLVARLPDGEPLFPDDVVTDQPTQTRLAELIREQALAVTREEVPHSIAVVIEEMDGREALTRVHATLLVERESQKGIVIGQSGETLKRIGTRARAEMEGLLGTKVFLDLRVKVLKEWQRDPRALDRLGF
jgi:GTP-binding protein Era